VSEDFQLCSAVLVKQLIFNQTLPLDAAGDDHMSSESELSLKMVLVTVLQLKIF
jgi:hypothetical protein